MEQFATRCPHCQTSFRVTPAQLERRGGKVRCGVCHESFDGIDQLFDYSDDAPLVSASGVAATATATASESGYPDWEPAAPVAAPDFGSPDAPHETSMHAELDALSLAIADLQASSRTITASPGESPSATADSAHDQHSGDYHQDTVYQPADTGSAQPPGFVQQAQRQEHRRRLWKILLWIGIPLLILALVVQLGYTFRNDLAARSPQAARQLRSLCARMGCTIRLPMQVDQLSLSSSRLDISPLPTPVAGTDGQPASSTDIKLVQRLTLIALLRNQGDTVQAWPSIDLRLKGPDGKIYVRKAFLPEQYVRAEDLPVGMQAHAEMEIRVPFELAHDAPSAFELTLFYH